MNEGGWQAIQSGRRVVAINDKSVWAENAPQTIGYKPNLRTRYYMGEQTANRLA